MIKIFYLVNHLISNTVGDFLKSPVSSIYERRRLRVSFLIVISAILLSVSLCFAQDISFESSVDRTKIALGSNLQLSLNFYGTQDITAPDLPQIEGFDWRYAGPSTRVSIVNSKVSSSITHIYILIPLKTGVFTIPSVSVQYKGNTYTSKPITVEVANQQTVASAPAGQQSGVAPSAVQGIEDRVFITMEVDKSKVYINEVIPVTIKLYLNNLPVSDIQYPEILHDGFSIEEFGEPKKYTDFLNGVSYDVFEFQTNVFALRQGELKLGQVSLKCNLLMKSNSQGRGSSSSFDDFFDNGFFNDFFAQYQKYPLNLNSPEIPITVISLPEEGKPVDFSGALGDYQFSLDVSPKEVKAGDPITLKMIITGKGNFKTVQEPSFSAADDFKIYEPQVKQEETSKTFEQVVIPKSDKVKDIPEITFNFFDTTTGKYREIKKGPVSIKVDPPAMGGELKIFEASVGGGEVSKAKKEILGQDIIYIKDTPDDFSRKGWYLYKNKFLIISAFGCFVAVIFVWIFQKRKEYLETDVRYARRLAAGRKAKKNLLMVKRLLESQKTEEFFNGVFKTLQEYLGDKFHLSTAGITPGVIDVLGQVNEEILVKLKECFDNCDAARYSSSNITREDMRDVFKLLEQVIDELEKVKA
ncbi:MAG: BatD family protein [Candidatus Omnitrophota bacterium]